MKKNSAVLFMLVYLFLPLHAFSSTCTIKGDAGQWSLEVDGKPYDLKGVGCGDITGKNGADYFALAKEMGANTLRTWGVDQGTQIYLDKAHDYGFKVDAGVWFNHCNWMKKKKVFSYISDTEKVADMEKQALDYVKRYKDHPAVIMWNLGNEVLFFTMEEEERIAFCRFLERVVKKVKAIDPSHLVLYTAYSGKIFPYLKEHVPSLDLIGINTYGSVEGIQEAWKDHNIKIPYIITEAGPLGPWDVPKDEFGLSVDQADYEKAFRYQYLLEEIERFDGYCLGGFMFYLGDTTQESLTWWNLTIGPLRRESYCTIKKFYTGQETENKPPLCIGLEIDKNIMAPLAEVKAIIKARDREKDVLSYEIVVGTSQENILQHIVNKEVPVKILKKGQETVFIAPEKPGIYKLHAFVTDGKGNVSTRTLSFKVEDLSVK